MSTSITRNASEMIAASLINVLSDTYVLAVKTHGFHWNVTGPLFPQLHAQFSDQYEALFEAADDIAERIRALDLPAPTGMASFLANTVIKETDSASLSATAMIKDLHASHEALRVRLADACDKAGEYGDKTTEDLMVERLHYHDKVIWMLRSQLV